MVLGRTAALVPSIIAIIASVQAMSTAPLTTQRNNNTSALSELSASSSIIISLATIPSTQVKLKIYLPLSELDKILAAETITAARRAANTAGSLTPIPRAGYQNAADGIAFGVGLRFYPALGKDIAYETMIAAIQGVYDYFLHDWNSMWRCNWWLEDVQSGGHLGRGLWELTVARSNLEEVER